MMADYNDEDEPSWHQQMMAEANKQQASQGHLILSEPQRSSQKLPIPGLDIDETISANICWLFATTHGTWNAYYALVIISAKFDREHMILEKGNTAKHYVAKMWPDIA